MPKLKDGLVKRGSTWSYVIRVPDPTTGRSRPLWVGGYPTESAAKIARDEARYLAKRGELVGRSQVTLEAYLTGWLEGHPTPCLQDTRCEFYCASTLFIHRCLSTDSEGVGVAQYRAMPGVREHSAPTDAPTGSRSNRFQD